MESLEPGAYAVKYTGAGVAKLKYPNALWANKYPTAHFRVWPKGTWDTNNYSRGANVSIVPRFAPDHYTLGSVAIATVDADNGYDGHYVRLESGLHTPQLDLELDEAQPVDERTLKVIQTIAARAVADRVAMFPQQ